MKVILLLILTLFAVPALAEKVTFQYSGRNYTMIVPKKNKTVKKPLLVLLHGCKQNPEIITTGTKLDEEALKNDFILLAPEQPLLANVDRCWNWFLSYNQQRGQLNEMGQIIGAIEHISKSYPIDAERTYLAGMSAGGVMAHNMSVCYPDYFAGVAIHAGLAYKVAETIYEAQNVLTASNLKSPNYLGRKAFECARSVKSKRLKKMILIHGEEDKRVDPYHTQLISKTTEVQMDYLDDGSRNNSTPPFVSETRLRFPNGYSALLSDRIYPNGLTERVLLINGLAHAWGGGNPISDNFDGDAPSSNAFILNFLQLKR